MNDKEEIIKLLNDYFNPILENTKIGNIRKEMFRYTYVTEINTYDDLSINSFIILYKIDRLLELNIIAEDIANLLKELSIIREKIMKEYMTILYKIAINNNQEYYIYLKNKLYNKIKLIDNKLKQYHLDLYDYNKLVFDIPTIIDNDIKKEKYDNIDNNKKLNNFVKALKKDFLN